MHKVNFDDELVKIVEHDPRYSREAYIFVREALDYTQNQAGKPAKDELRHVTGGQLLEGIRDYALRQFGPMAPTVFEEWGITQCLDFGDIVFNMIAAGLLAKTEKDSREDFRHGYDFQEAFRKPFIPPSRGTSTPLTHPQSKT